jgi:CRP-like cAMP-binding protein
MDGNPTEAGEWPAESFMSWLDVSVRRKILLLGRRRCYAPGVSILVEGERTSHAHVVLSGLVKVLARTEEGQEAFLSVRARGDIVGELAATDGGPRTATVVASGDVETCEISAQALRAFLRAEPTAGAVLQRVLVHRMRVATKRRVELCAYPVPVRIARVLAELSRLHGRKTEHGLSIDFLTQTDLAAAAGCAEASVHQVLRDLRKSGVVKTGYGKITVCDIPDLERTAGSISGQSADSTIP